MEEKYAPLFPFAQIRLEFSNETCNTIQIFLSLMWTFYSFFIFLFTCIVVIPASLLFSCEYPFTHALIRIYVLPYVPKPRGEFGLISFRRCMFLKALLYIRLCVNFFLSNHVRILLRYCCLSRWNAGVKYCGEYQWALFHPSLTRTRINFS